MQGASIAASFLLHVGIVALLSITLTFGNRPEFLDVPQVIAIDLVSIGEETVVKPTELEESVDEAPPAPPAVQPKVDDTPVEPEESAALPEEAKPQPTKQTQAKQGPEKTLPPEDPAKPKEEPKKEPPPIDESSALDDFAKLIDRSKEPAAPKRSAEEEFFATFGKDQPRGKVADSREQSISLVDAARTQVQRCWAPPLGARDAASMRIRVSVLLGPDGEVIGSPTLDPSDQRRMRRSDETVFRVFAESAVRAIQQCAPFKLPKSRYGEWRTLRLNFDPSQMLN